MKKILVIQNKRIGDVLIASLIADNIISIFPDAEVHYFVYDYTAGVIENHPNINTIFRIQEKSLKKIPNLVAAAFKIRRENYDIIFDPYAKFQSRFICLCSGASTRVGFKKRKKNPILPFYTHNVNFLEEKTQICGKSIEDRIHLVNSAFSLENPIYEPKIHLNEKEINYQKLEPHQGPIVMFGILGSTPRKSMPYNYVVKLVDSIITTFKVKILFNYAPHQKDEALTIYRACKNKEAIIFDVYEDSIRGFIQVMNQCSVLVSNEGGAVHIAKALQKPTFTMFSPYVLKSHWASFEDGIKHTSIHLLDVHPELFSTHREERKKIEQNPRFLYEQLTPELILPQLKQFLEHHLNHEETESN